ncbi:MAG: EpsG family protein [Lachnospiraceae bacterium]
MTVYIITLLLILLFWPICEQTNIKNKRGMYVVIISIWLMILAALRNYTVGADTLVYMNRFKRFGSADWKTLMWLSNYYNFEYGFSILYKLVYYVIQSPRGFMFLSNAFIIWSFSRYIYKESEIPWLSYLLFVTLGLHNNSLNILRQMLAIAIILFAYEAIQERRLLKFLLAIALATSIHYSAAIVIPMFWLSRIKFDKKMLLLTWVGTIFVFFSGAAVINAIAKRTKYGHFIEEASDSNGAIGATIIYVTFSVIIIWKLYRCTENYRNIYIAFSVISVAIIILTFAISIIDRLGLYFSTMYIVSVPNALSKVKKRNIRNEYIFLIAGLVIVYYLFVICKADVSMVIPFEIWNDQYNIF